MVKILLTGASGLLGREVMVEARQRNFDIVGLAFTRIGDNLRKCDLTDPEDVTKVFESIKPDIVIHSAAERFPDRVESQYERAKNLNINSTGLLSQLAKNNQSKFLYISTDYVFDGTNPPYKDDDTPNPLNQYGFTKFEGEKISLANYPDCCVLRIPVLYGNVEYLGESAVTTLLKSVTSKEEQFVSHREKRYPASTWDIAKIICDMIPLMVEKSLKGIFHWSGQEMLTKYDMALKIASALSLPSDHLKPQTEASSQAAVTRPLDSRLDNTKLVTLAISHHTPFEEGVKRALAQWI